jgi:hypothetical protein
MHYAGTNWVSVGKAAEQLDISRSTLKRAIQAGHWAGEVLEKPASDGRVFRYVRPRDLRRVLADEDPPLRDVS